MITIVPLFLVRLIGRGIASVICSIITISAYILLYRILATYAPFRVDAVYYITAVLIFHFGLVTYVGLRNLDEQ